MAVSTGEASENQTVYRLRWLGYGFLVFALIDAIHVLISVRTADPTWLLQTIGQFVERVVVPLLGFALIFFGEFFGRKGIEKIWLRILSWLCLVLAIAFFLMIPPALFQSVSLNSQAGQQVDKQEEQALAQLKQVEEQIKRSKPEEIQAIANQLNKTAGVAVDPKDPEAVKALIQARIKTTKEQLQIKAQEAKSQGSGLFKNAIKWSLGALVAGVLFVYLWISSNWAR